MAARGKGAAVADIAADLAIEGSSVARTGEAPGNPDADLFAALDAEAAGFERATIAPPRRGPGRPPGSPNRTTLQLQRYLQAKGYRDPAEFLAAIQSMDTLDLARVLAGTPPRGNVTFDQAAEALRVQMRAASELLPYFHQRLPQQVEHRGEGARPLIIIADGVPGRRTDSADDGALSVLDIEGFQRVASEADAPDGSDPASGRTD